MKKTGWTSVLFDIDDTLVDFKKSEAISLEKCHERYFSNLVGLEEFKKEYRQINRSFWRQVEEGTISSSKVGQLRFEQLSSHYRMPKNPEIAHFYEQQLIENTVWIDGAVELLDELVRRKMKIGFVTNGFAHIQRGKYQTLQLGRYSNILIISEEFGFAKPHPNIFFHALDQIKATPAETLMVGDSLTSDGAGALNVGMPFCWYNPEGIAHGMDWEPDFIIQTLKELYERSDTER